MTLVQTMDFVVRPWPCFVCYCKAAVRVDAAGRANIYVNPRLSKKGIKQALKHELRHVELNHLSRIDRSQDECESEVRSDPVLRSSVIDAERNIIFEGKS